MSKYIKQNRLDEKAIAIISDFFNNKYGDLFDLQFHGIKDNTPDTDGFLRLRKKGEKEMEGKNLNQIVFFQLKGKGDKIKNNSYSCEIKLINFCNEINLPTILFVVGNLKEEDEPKQIYWYHFSEINTEILNHRIQNKTKGEVTIPNLNLLKLGEKDDITYFYGFIKNLAKKNYFLDVPKPILDLSVEHKNNIIKVSNVIYMLGKIEKSDIKKISTLLKLKESNIERIIKQLKDKEILYFKNKLIFYKDIKDEFDKDIGLLILYEGVTELLLEKTLDNFPNHKKHVLLSLSKVFHPIIDQFLLSHVESLKHIIKDSKDNNDIYNQLELLEQYIGRVPDQAIKILKFIINLKNPLKAVTRHDKVWGKIEGKSHDNLIEKSIELLELLRYIKQKDVFNLLLKLVKSSNNSIKEKANNVFKKIAGYDYTALQKIGYQPQMSLLDRIEKYKEAMLKSHFETFSIILSEIVNPSFGGTKMVDYQTLKLYQGALVASEKLQQIRSRAIEIIKKLYLLSKTNQQRKGVLHIFEQATQLPTNYKKRT